MGILEGITEPEDIKSLTGGELNTLCSEIRTFLTENIARSGGHLSSNLGVVELTVALHRVFDTARDRVVFDVGHQAYTHKILTGRRECFPTLRGFGGISGFPHPDESVHDAFIAGHASTSVSVALGLARARTLMGDNYHVAAVIGDGALTGGLAYEGLCNAGVSGEPIVVILNDNGMSINQNVGAVAGLLRKMRVKPQYFDFKRAYRLHMARVPRLYRTLHSFKERLKTAILHRTFFEQLGFYYLGPVDGTDLRSIEAAIRWARELRQPVLLHVKTQKGRGVPFAEQNPGLYHGVGSFDAQTGGMCGSEPDFSEVFGDELTKIAKRDSRVCAITAAMEDGTGLGKFARELPERFFDVGIAEGHAVSMAAGMAKGGMVPVFAVYSSFLQRAYDMLIHDAALLNLHVVIGVDRAGLVGRDGVTHQGVFDAAFLSGVPNMRIYAPASYAELRDMLAQAVLTDTGPVAVRYPRGCEGEYRAPWDSEPSTIVKTGSDITLVTYGVIINEALSAARLLEKDGVSAEVVKLNILSPPDANIVYSSARKTGSLIVAEDSVRAGGIGERLLAGVLEHGAAISRTRLINAQDGVITHGEAPELRHMLGLDAEGLRGAALDLLERCDEKSQA